MRSVDSAMSVSEDRAVPLAALRGVTKRYGSAAAVAGLDLEVYPGEVHALVGENGSGKSTACKMLAGVVRPDEGAVEIRGKIVQLRVPADARALGVAMVYQEFSLVDSMTIAQNLQLGREPRFFTQRRINSTAQETLATLSFVLEPSTLVGALGSAHKQMVEIAKAVGSGARCVLFDEPTATLTPEEKRQLFYTIEQLRESGLGIVFVSHVLEEALEHADRITVLRDGVRQLTAPASSLTREELVRNMVGRDVHYTRYRASRAPGEEPALVVRDLSFGNIVRQMSFSIRRGEVVGIAGLVGSGRTETSLVVAGATKRNRLNGGWIEVDGRHVRFKTPRSSVRHGVGYVTEDRKRDGFFEAMGIEENVYLGWLAKHRRFWVSRRTARDLTERFTDAMSIRSVGAKNVKQLSGGNQQKVVIAKTLAQDPEVIILDEPTRGVDVGAIEQIHRLIRDLADEGKAVVVISSYLPEVLAVSDRVLVARGGKIVAEFDPDVATEEDVLFAAVH